MASPEHQEPTTCYRHPRNETAVSCSHCDRPICTDCMVYTSVGIKCPECAGTESASRPKQRARSFSTAALTGAGAPITKAIIAINVAVFVLQLAQSDGFNATRNELFIDGALFGPAVADGDWYRLGTSAFLHANFIHVCFNMLILWWFGRGVEEYLGSVRYLGVYVVSVLAGASGALLIAPDTPTIGASGAVFGILGAGLVLERQGIYVYGGSALFIVALNIVLSFVLSSVSVGGHLGGLAGGALAMLAITRLGRLNVAASVLGLVAVGALSLAIAYSAV